MLHKIFPTPFDVPTRAGKKWYILRLFGDICAKNVGHSAGRGILSLVDTAAFCFDDSVRELPVQLCPAGPQGQCLGGGLAVVAGRGGSFPGGCALDNARQRDAADVQRQVVNLGGAGVVGGCLRPVKFPSQQLPAFRGNTAPGQRELCGIVGLRGAGPLYGGV